MKNRSIILLSLISLIIVSIISCREEGKEQNQMIQSTKTEVYIANYENFSINTQTTGELLPIEEINLTTSISGIVTGIYFTEGQQVTKNQILIEQDNRNFKAKKAGLEAQQNNKISILNRLKNLYKSGGASTEEIEQLEAEIALIKSQIDETEISIDLSQIKAPFDGKIGLRNISIGSYLNQGTIFSKLVKNNPLKVDFSISSKYGFDIKQDQTIYFFRQNTTDTFAAKIYAIDPRINSSTRSLQVRALVNNSDQKLIAGEFVEIIVPINFNENAILIPAQAIISELNSQVVYLVKNGVSKKQKIEIGLRTKNRVQIKSGINQGDTIILTGLMRMTENQSIIAKPKKY